MKRLIHNCYSETAPDNPHSNPCMFASADCLTALRRQQLVRISYVVVFDAWPTLCVLSNEMDIIITLFEQISAFTPEYILLI